ncbi:MAG TPA: hypothetical protein VN420_03125 [Candidatus Fimivivens sp.]|nr:hypothetical protein [Candidatus Fimivivens sp.]
MTTGSFVLVATAAAFVSFLMLSRMLHGYTAECSVLVIPGVHAMPSTDLVNDVVFLSRTSGFREQLFQDAGPYIKGDPDILTRNGRAELLDSGLSVSASATPNVISVRATADDPLDAGKLARTASLSLFRYVSRYYDIREKADFRIVDGPLVTRRSLSVLSRLSLSVAIGIAISTMLSVLVALVGRFSRYSVLPDRSRTAIPLNPFGADIFRPKRPVSPILSEVVLTEKEPTREQDSFFEPEPTTREVVNVFEGKKAPAPLDIPTYSEEEARFLKEFSFESTDESEDHDSATVSDDTDTVRQKADAVATAVEEAKHENIPEHETPSQAEFRRRLNELLQG